MIEKTRACLCCWFLEGESNRNHVITPIFLPCPSVVFPEYLVYLRNWCFLCYHRLPVSVTHHLKKRRLSSLCCKCQFWLGKQTSEVFCSLTTASCLSVCCILFILNVAAGQTLGGQGSKGTFWHKHQSQDLNSSLPARELSCPDCKCTQ